MTTLPRRAKPPAPAPTNQCVVGIDQSYSGFALCILSHDGTFTMHRKAFTGTGVDRLQTITQWVSRLFYDEPSDVMHICMEGYAPGAKFGREIAGELGATVKLCLRRHARLASPISYPTIVAPTALKKFVTGKGSGAKNVMLLHVHKRWGVEFDNDNEADAYGLARMAAQLAWGSHSPQEDAAANLQWAAEDLTGYQQSALQNLRHHTER